MPRNPNVWAEAGKNVMEKIGENIESKNRERIFDSALSSLEKNGTDDPINFLKSVQKASQEDQKLLIAGFEAKKAEQALLKDKVAAQQIGQQEGIKVPEGWGTKDLMEYMKTKTAQTKANKAASGGKTSDILPTEQTEAVKNIIENNPDIRPEDLQAELVRPLDKGGAGLSPAQAKTISDQRAKTQENTTKEFDRSYERSKDFIQDTSSAYRSWISDTKPKIQQLQKLNTDEELISPSAATFLEAFDIPIGVVDSPTSEVYEKTSQDLLKGLPDTYGSRILKVEVDNFLRTIPRLVNSPEGRRMIASNLLKLGEMKEVFYKEMRSLEKSYQEKGKNYPIDFEREVLDNVEPQLNKISDEFRKITEIKAVPPNTVPFFNPQGGISFVPNDPKSIEFAEKNQGKRIW
jgi:hypothetical protein